MPTSPQVVYEMFVECVEPIHKAYDRMSLSTSKPDMTATQLNTMLKEKMAKLETFHKERLHRDSYTAAKNYLNGIKEVNAYSVKDVIGRSQNPGGYLPPSLESCVRRQGVVFPTSAR